MEAHDGFPEDKTRRWAIARIVQMGLFFNQASLGVEAPLAQTPQFPVRRFSKLKLDISDHQAALKQGWTQGDFAAALLDFNASSRRSSGNHAAM